MKTTLLSIFFCTLLTASIAQSIQFSGYIPEIGEMTKTEVIAAGSATNGDVYFINARENQILKYSSGGSLLGQYGRVSINGVEVLLKAPKALYIDQKDRLIVYDDILSRILVQDENGAGFSFGEKGSGPGKLDKVSSIACDSDGYFYILSGDRKQIDVYDPLGRFVTWFGPSSTTFIHPIALAINAYNEVYVLDAEGTSVVMLDAAGNMINACRSLASKSGVTATKPVAFTALHNGDFLILDASGSITHFSRLGDVLGVIGSKGKSAAGVFEQPTILTSSLAKNAEVTVVDFASKRNQRFTVHQTPGMRVDPVKKFRIDQIPTNKSDIEHYYTSPNGTSYIIRKKEKESVYVYSDSSSKAQLIIQTKVSQPLAVITDKNSNVYVLDGKSDEVVVFDKAGVFLKRFGQDIPTRLKDPTDMAFQNDGGLLVIDQSNGALHRWSPSGTYDRILFTKEKSGIQNPAALCTDSKDNIYIYCSKQQCIYKISPSGWPVQIKQLKTRGDKPGKDGTIGDLYIDPLDQLHVFNPSNNQMEIYSWVEEPLLKFHFGRSGDGFNGLSDVSTIHFDRTHFIVYMADNKGKARAYRLYLQPPTPKGNYNFDADENGLLVQIEKLNNSTVVGYALITKGINVPDSVVSRSSGEILQIRTDQSKFPALKHYQLVSYSPTDISEPAEGFDDYYTYGNRLLLLEKYDEGFEALKQAQTKMKCSSGMTARISENISHACARLAERGEVMKALPMIRYAFSISPDNKLTAETYSKVYYTYYQQLADRNEYGAIITETERLIGHSEIKAILLRAVDSLSFSLADLPNEKAIHSAILLQKKLVEWDNDQPSFYGSLLYSHLKMYTFKKNSGTPEFELLSILKEADKYGLMAVSGLKKQQRSYFGEQLLQLEVMNAVGRYEEVEKTVVQELAANSYGMSPAMIGQYREYLAESYMLRGKYDVAALEYQRILNNDPKNAVVKEKLANAYLKGNKPDESRNIYLELLAEDRFNGYYTGQLGRIELLRNNYVEASFQLEKAIKLNPGDRSFYGPLAEAFQGANNLQKAIDNYNIAIPYEESKLQIMKNKFGSELEIAEQVSLLKKYLSSVALLCENVNQFNDAIFYYKKLIQVDVQNAQAYYGLGKCNLNAGYIYDATNAFYSACRIEPANDTYTAAYSNALKLRDKHTSNSEPIDILEVRIPDVYPSLYKNYSDVRLLPLGEIIVANNSSAPITPTSIEVFSKDIMSSPTPVNTSVLVGYSNSGIPISAVFNDKILSNLTDEKKQLEVEIKYKVNGVQKSSKKSMTFTLKGRNVITWKDKRRLSAFVSPNIEEFISYSRQIDQRYADEQTYGIQRNLLKAVQVYSELAARKMIYSPDPTVSFATVSVNTDMQDFLQYPAETMQRKSGDCDDLVALFCCILENAGIATAYIDIPGHVFMAFDTRIRPEDLVQAGISPTDVIIEDNKVWLPVETTLIGSGDFLQAWKEGASRYYRELINGNFPELVSFYEARSVYIPSSYIPDGFHPLPGSEDSAIANYNALLSKLLIKLKKGVITELENRYVTETQNVFVKNKYATLLAQTGDFENAERIYTEALELSPSNSVTLNNLGNLYYIRGNGEQAEEYYLKASELDPGDGEIFINLCKAQLLAGKKPAAMQSFDKATKINSKLAVKYLTLKNQIK